MKNYYIFLLIEDVPFLEIQLDEKKKAVVNLEQIDWDKTKYIILNFKVKTKEKSIITEGLIKDNQKVMTDKLNYFEINTQKAHEIWKEKKSISKKEKQIIELSEKLFYSSPDYFLRYMKQKKLFSNNELAKYESALHTIKTEKEMLASWHLSNKK